MSAEADYLRAEREGIRRTLNLVQDLLAKQTRSQFETIALGKLLQDVYSGLERILRALLEERGVRIEKGERWHKDLLLAARKESFLSPSEFEAFRKLLLFRHVEVHGYGFTLEDERLAALACSVIDICYDFLSHSS
ncbi:MAG: hypothetical protein KBE65_14400 [Phycisphaerae bacterium]|nr:hypothetical protein [Phycisphaerae bacterium]